MDYVKDSQLTRDEQDSFGPQYSAFTPVTPRKRKKKRFLGFRSILIFLLVAGVGYFLYGKYYNRTGSFVTASRQPFRKYFSMNAKSKKEEPTATKALPDASDVPKQIQSKRTEDFSSSAIDSSKSGIPKAAVPQKTESFQPGSVKEFSQNAEAASFPKEPDHPEADDKAPAMKPDKYDSLNAMPKTPLNTALSKKTTEIANYDKPRSDIKPKTESAKLTEKKPVPIPAPKIKKESVRVADSGPAQFHETSKNETSAKKAVSKPMEKSKTAETTPQPVQKRNNVEKPETLKRGASKKELTVASSAASEKQTKALFEEFKENLSKKTVVSENVRPAKPPAPIMEKTPSAASVSDQKSLLPQKAANRSDQGTEERIASFGGGTNMAEKTKKTQLTYIPLMTRIETFLKKYCQTYEQKNIDKFSNLFALNAVEKGKPFKSWFPTYRRNFKRINSIEYNIDLNRYATQEETGLVKIDGTFHIRAKLDGSKEWLKNSGDISMVLEADGNSFKVKELNY